MMQSTLLLLCCCLFALQVLGQFGQDSRFSGFGAFRNPPPPQARVPAVAATPAPVRSANCPEANGRYPLSGQCDAYIECRDGVAEQKLCPDGLLFNEKAGVFTYPCSYPIDVECAQGRQALQSAQPTDDCPHQFGYFRLGDASHCGQFMNCVDGRGFVFDCPEGLAFNKETYHCDWPDQVLDCDAEAFLGFTCPPEARVEGLGEAAEGNFYRSPHDCQRYFSCHSGRPRLHSCSEGYAFNELINACDGIENVTSCYNPSTSYRQQQQVQPVSLQPTPRPSNFRTQPTFPARSSSAPFSQRFPSNFDTRGSFFK